MNNYIAPTKKYSGPISIVIYGSAPQNRMSSFGPKSLFKIKNRTILDYQVEAINNFFTNYELFICAAHDIHKMINHGFKIVENQTGTNECEDIRLALNLCSHKNILLIDQAAIFKSLKYRYHQSFIVCGEGKEEVSVNQNDQVACLSFNDNPIKWKGVTFIHNKDFNILKSCLDTGNYKNNFLFELINILIELNVDFSAEKGNGTIITTPKELKEANESINSII